MTKHDIVKQDNWRKQVTRLEAVLARMVELEASQDPYMLQVIDLVIFLLSHVVTLNILPFFIIASLQQRIIKLLSRQQNISYFSVTIVVEVIAILDSSSPNMQVLNFLKGGKFEKISRWMWQDDNYKEVIVEIID